LVADRTMADGLIQDSTSALGSFFLDVAGVRKAGETLQFTVENYDDQNTYMMDFGNGYRRRVRQNFSYTYPRQGNFQAKLIATRDQASSLYVKNLRISPGEVSERTTPIAAAELPEENLANELPDIDLEEEGGEGNDSANQTAGLRVGNMPELEIVDLQAADEEVPEVISDAGTTTPESVEPTNIPVSEEPEAVTAEIPINTPMIAADIMPEYPGGTRGIARYFQRNYRYPYEARKSRVEGVVHVRFVVQPDGKLSDFVVVKGVGYGCDEEAIRLLQKMPKWRAGEHQGKAVPVYRTLPITFRLAE
ncbi:MAG: TonB family protein, partial [Bacteroidota bacterium]